MKKEKITAYKVFTPDFRCRGFQFEIGKTYQHEGPVKACSSGFHSCLKLVDCFNYYNFNPNNKVAIVQIWGETETHDDDSKIASEFIKIVKELAWHEVLDLANTGTSNTGKSNTGKSNSGDSNSGHNNSGDRNSGNYNSGHNNSGYNNSGYNNSGDYNSGDSNTGNRNPGNYNSGDYNSGYYNSGHRNSGHRNSGHYNSGDYNSGHRNSGDWNAGRGAMNYFCSQNMPIFCFNQPTILSPQKLNKIMPDITNYKITRWIHLDNMTDKEKSERLDCETLGGYLKIYTYFEMCQNGWAKDDDKNKLKFFNLPNFSLEIFKEITGIDASEDYKRLCPTQVWLKS